METNAGLAPVSPEWIQWGHRIRQLLGVDGDRPLDDQPLRAPWLLAPSSSDLSEKELGELCEVVRAYLLGDRTRSAGSSCLRRLGVLSAWDSLPLLYAMRGVAQRWGRHSRYWPVFATLVLGGLIEITYVRMSLAPALRRLWIAFYEATGGSLYRPRVGRINIRWPLAHAGLLAEDTQILHAYGQYLIETDDAPALLWAEVDEFLTDFAVWLSSSPLRRFSPLGTIICSTESGVALTVAELAQSWLAQHLSEFSTPRIDTGLRRIQKNRPPRVTLQWDTAHEQFGVAIGSSCWDGQVLLEVRLGGTHTGVPATWDFGRETHSPGAFIPLSTPNWPAAVEWLVDGVRAELRIPASPFTGATGVLLTRAPGGTATRRWEPDESYYVIARSETLQADWADALFDGLVPQSTPRGEWDGIQVHLGRASNPLLGVPAEERANRLELLGEALEAAQAYISLPSVWELLRPRITPVGVVQIRSSDGSVSYLASEPPSLRLDGTWLQRLDLRLERWDSATATYRTVDSVLLQATTPAGAILSPEWPPVRERAGHYRVTIGGRDLAMFKLVDPPDCSGPTLALRMTCHREGEALPNEGDDIRISRETLEEGELHVAAWPESEITFEFASTSSRVRRRRWTDAEGLLRERFQDLDVRIPFGESIAVRPLAGPIAGNALRCTEGIGLERYTFHFEYGGDGLYFAVRVHAAPQGRGPRVILIGRRPWEGELWFGTAEVDGEILHGHLDVPTIAGWLCVLPEQPDSDDIAWLVTEIGQPSWNPPTVGEIMKGSWSAWLPIAGTLERSARPLSILPILRVTKEHEALAALSGNSTCRWLPLIAQAERLALALPALEDPIGVFDGSVRLNLETSRDLANTPIVLVGEVAGDPNHYATAYRGKRLRSQVVDREEGFYLVVRDELVACTSCGFILPRENWNTHGPLGFWRLVTCTGLRTVGPGEVPVHIGVRWDDHRAMVVGIETVIKRLDAAGPESDDPLIPLIRDLGNLYGSIDVRTSPQEWLRKIVQAVRLADSLKGNPRVTAGLGSQVVAVQGLAEAVAVLRKHLSTEAVWNF